MAVAEPEPEPEPVGDLLYEVVVDMGEVATGVRAWADGRIDVGGGAPDDLTWHSERKLNATDLAELHALLDAPGTAALPDVLPHAPEGPAGPAATWRLATPSGLRTISATSFHAVRVPAFERIDTMLRGARRLLDTSSRWIDHTGAEPVAHDVPCDAIRIPVLQGLTSTLLAVDLPAASEERPGPILLDVTFVTGTRSRHTVVHTDGRLFRTDAEGQTHAFQLAPDRVAALQAAVARVPWQRIADSCP